MSSHTKPREFWIDAPQGDEDAIVYQSELEGCIHVIEFEALLSLNSAYEALRKERDEMAKKFREVFGPAGFKSVSKMLEERDQLRAELEFRKNAEIPVYKEENDKLRADLKLAVEALKLVKENSLNIHAWLAKREMSDTQNTAMNLVGQVIVQAKEALAKLQKGK